MEVTIYIRDAQNAIIGQLRPISGTAILKHAGFGTWNFALDVDDPHGSRLQPGYGIICVDSDTLETVFSGPLSAPDIDAPEGSPEVTLNVFGYTDEVHLNDRIMYPSPNLSDELQFNGTASHYVRTGDAETVMRTAVDDQAGPAALPERRVRGLILEPTNLNRGPATTVNTRYVPNLLETLVEISNTSGLGFRVLQSGANLVFSVTSPTDLSLSAVFSRDRGSLNSYRYGLKAPTVTDVSVAGQGELKDRLIKHSATNRLTDTMWGRRIEQFQDRRDADSVSVLIEAGYEAWVEGGSSSMLELNTIDLPNLSYGKDYKLGDLVTVELESGISISEVIRQVTLTWTPGGLQVTPLVGTESYSDPKEPRSVKIIRDMMKRLGKLEAEK